MKQTTVELIQIIADVITGLAWPAAFLTFIFLFKNGIESLFRDLFRRTEKVSGFGVEASFREELDKVTRNLENIQDSPGVELGQVTENVLNDPVETAGIQAKELNRFSRDLIAIGEKPVEAFENLLQGYRDRFAELHLERDIDTTTFVRTVDKLNDRKSAQQMKSQVRKAVDRINETKTDVIETSSDAFKVSEALLEGLKTNQSDSLIFAAARTALQLRILVRYAEGLHASIEFIEKDATESLERQISEGIR